MSSLLKIISCNSSCKYYEKEWPKNLSTPLCRIFYKYNNTNNPVTKSVYEDIIKTRMKCSYKFDNIDNGELAESGLLHSPATGENF